MNAEKLVQCILHTIPYVMEVTRNIFFSFCWFIVLIVLIFIINFHTFALANPIQWAVRDTGSFLFKRIENCNTFVEMMRKSIGLHVKCLRARVNWFVPRKCQCLLASPSVYIGNGHCVRSVLWINIFLWWLILTRSTMKDWSEFIHIYEVVTHIRLARDTTRLSINFASVTLNCDQVRDHRLATIKHFDWLCVTDSVTEKFFFLH